MSLTEVKIKELEAKGFDGLYTKHERLWKGLAHNAKTYAKDHICGGSDPRPDDTLKMLLPMIEGLDQLLDHQEEQKARAKSYQTKFGEYIIDKNP